MPEISIDWTLGVHLYLLKHESLPYFKLSQTTSISSRDTPFKDPIDTPNSIVAFFDSTHKSKTAANYLRKEILEQKIKLSVSTSNWYPLSIFDKASAFLKDLKLSTATCVHPLEYLRPLDSEKAKTIKESEKAFLEAINRQKEEDYKARILAQAEEKKIAVRKFLSGAIANDFWLSPAELRNSTLMAIEANLRELNRLANGFCKLAKNKFDEYALEILINKHKEAELLELVKMLQQLVFFVEIPDLKKDLAELPFICPFGRIDYPSFPKVHPNFVHLTVSIRNLSLMENIIRRLNPGVRGWDLAIDAKVLGYDPAFSRKKTAPLVDATSAELAKNAWSRAVREEPLALLKILKNRGLHFTWSPPAIRYMLSSPFSNDGGAPLLLAKVTSPLNDTYEQIGVLKLNLLTNVREVIYFDETPELSGVLRIWTPQNNLNLCVSIEDSFALQNRTRLPALTLLSPKALADLKVPEVSKQVSLFMPKLTSDWKEAMHVFKEKAAKTNVDVSIFALPDGSSNWRDFIAKAGSFDKALEHPDIVQ